MKKFNIVLLSFIFFADASNAQVMQKKINNSPSVTNPVFQKQIITPQKTEQKKAVSINPAEKQFVKQDTANAKLTDVIIDMVYSDCVGTDLEDITRHYKPQIDLFDKSNNAIAHWDFTNGIQNQIFENYPGDINGFYQALHVTLSMKIENTPASFASLTSGTLKIRIERFFDQLTGGGDDCFNIKSIQLTLKFQNPVFSTMAYNKEDHQYLNFKKQSAEFYFANQNHIYSIRKNL